MQVTLSCATLYINKKKKTKSYAQTVKSVAFEPTRVRPN